MAYSNGVFYLDLVNGSDAARTALTSCTASNPSGTITRINKTGHGLVTGAIVDLTLFSTWLNAAWKITVVDANNFDLDTAVWQTTADTSGTVTPRGGMNWADAWLTINSGATAARTQPGDEIRIAKTPDPVSLGQNATWTDGSQTVTLTTAVTKKVEDAISGWTAAANVTVGTNTSRKIGATAITITPAAAFTTGKVCYKAIDGGGTQNFSAFQYINFWIRPTSAAAIAADTYRICLCSDATGDTVVDALNIPAISANTAWQPIYLNRGAALGANIQSVAIYALVDPGAAPVVFSINNIFASNGNLSLKTLIGKTSECFYNIQSIDGTTIKIDSNNTAATGRGYSGTTETVTLYYRTVFQTAIITGSWQSTNEAGDGSGGQISYIGGWNTGSNTRDGLTVIANNVLAVGTGITMSNYITLKFFVFARLNTAVSVGSMNLVESCVFSAVASPTSGTGVRFSFIDCKILNISSGFALFGGYAFFKDCEFRNGVSYGVQITSGMEIIGCIFANHGSSSLNFASTPDSGTGSTQMRRCTLLDSSELSFPSGAVGTLWSYDHDDTPGNHWGFTFGGTINWQTSEKHDSDPGAWKIAVTSANRSLPFPISLKIAEVACAASSLVTVKVWVKKDHATNVGASIYVEDAAYNIDGVSATETTKASDTNWEELTLTFTPTQAGIVPIFARGWYVAGTSNAYIGSITVTQA